MMKRSMLTITMATALLANCAEPAGDPAAEAEAAFAAYVEAINQGDADAIAAMYDGNSGFHWIEQGEMRYSSGQEASASFAELTSSTSKAQMRTDDMQIAVLSQTSALISTHFDFALIDASGAEQFTFDGWMTVGFAKRKDGWKIAGGQTGPGRGAEPQ